LTPRLGLIWTAGSGSGKQAVSAAGRRRTGGGGLTGGWRHLAGVARGGTSGHSFRRGLALELAEVYANTTRGFRSGSHDDDSTQSSKGGRRRAPAPVTTSWRRRLGDTNAAPAASSRPSEAPAPLLVGGEATTEEIEAGGGVGFGDRAAAWGLQMGRTA
jgi:hypothetical protein